MARQLPSVRPVVFLFGAGISRGAQLPLAGDITPVVLCGTGVSRHTNGRYHFGPRPTPEIDSTDNFLRRVLLFLQLIKTEADIYYFLDRPVNYEDLYFIANQVFGCLSYDEDNPVVKPFADFLDDRLKHLLAGDCYADALAERNERPSKPIKYVDRLGSLRQLAGEVRNYIQDVACAMIGRKPASLSYLGWLADVVRDGDCGQKLFFTLNYDTVLEKFFWDQQVRVVDGFGEPVVQEGVSFFDPLLFADRQTPHVVKLHGSLDWFLNRRVGSRKSEPLRVLRPAVAGEAAKQYELDVAPLVLVGTHNKPSYYTNPLFEEQHWRFKGALCEAVRLVICGYSFGDKAINLRILHWLNQNPERQVLLIHHCPAECRKGARAAIAESWETHVENGQWRALAKKMEDVSWPEVKALILP
jgi:hypothetical protein